MDLILLFAVITVVTGYFPVTRELVITGTPARLFGVLLLLLRGPVLAIIDYSLTVVLPSPIRSSLGVGVLRWALFGALVFASARVFYNRTHVVAVPGPHDRYNFARRDRADGDAAAPTTADPPRTDRSASQPRASDLD